METIKKDIIILKEKLKYFSDLSAKIFELFIEVTFNNSFKVSSDEIGDNIMAVRFYSDDESLCPFKILFIKDNGGDFVTFEIDDGAIFFNYEEINTDEDVKAIKDDIRLFLSSKIFYETVSCGKKLKKIEYYFHAPINYGVKDLIFVKYYSNIFFCFEKKVVKNSFPSTWIGIG
ncbi:MAG TPA: hypothetical protein VEC12_07665 [Bacteroidia bacterium]|nr:hypothetical protein [Bacteroidia bacterium]